jgi:hypothetical protein
MVDDIHKKYEVLRLTLDLKGYRTGSINEKLNTEANKF